MVYVPDIVTSRYPFPEPAQASDGLASPHLLQLVKAVGSQVAVQLLGEGGQRNELRPATCIHGTGRSMQNALIGG